MFEDDPSDYLNEQVFPTLLPAMEDLLIKMQKRRIDGLDYLAEILWNCNPEHPERKTQWKNIFDIPQMKMILIEKPRVVYPKWSWFNKEEAIIYIQKHVRGWLVRKKGYVTKKKEL
ncbi:IQ domain-containing protein K-like [Prorops nasuta]|uniref:IQ domain-containing protein K-like n=1 Tax=Prorops nasuta TaxID=863751 RepID=UPI0034CEBCDE